MLLKINTDELNNHIERRKNNHKERQHRKVGVNLIRQGSRPEGFFFKTVVFIQELLPFLVEFFYQRGFVAGHKF